MVDDSTDNHESNDKLTIPNETTTKEDETYNTSPTTPNEQSCIFSGYINNKYAIGGYIEITDNIISGQYYYESTVKKYGNIPASYISLSGYIDNDNTAYLTATYENNLTEEWLGTLSHTNGNVSFNGNIYGSDGKEFTVRFNSK